MRRLVPIIALVLGGLSVGWASESRARPRAGKRADGPSARARSKTHFSGRRKRLRKSRIPRYLLDTPRPAPSSVSGLGRLDKKSRRGSAGGKSATVPGVARPKGVGPVQSPPTSTGPLEFEFVPPSKLADPTAAIHLAGGAVHSWYPGSVYLSSEVGVTFAVTRPPAGRVAKVRCALEFNPEDEPPQFELTIDNTTQLTQLPGAGLSGVVEFDVYPGSGDSNVSLKLHDYDEYKNMILWRTLGCDRRVD